MTALRSQVVDVNLGLLVGQLSAADRLHEPIVRQGMSCIVHPRRPATACTRLAWNLQFGVFHHEHQRGNGNMEKLRVYFDREGNTLSVWFDDPKKEHVCEETDDDVVLVKDRRGRVIGFERLNLLTPKQRAQSAGIPLEFQLL